MWWNRQTQQTQNLPGATPCRFDSGHRHQSKKSFTGFFFICLGRSKLPSCRSQTAHGVLPSLARKSPLDSFLNASTHRHQSKKSFIGFFFIYIGFSENYLKFDIYPIYSNQHIKISIYKHIKI